MIVECKKDLDNIKKYMKILTNIKNEIVKLDLMLSKSSQISNDVNDSRGKIKTLYEELKKEIPHLNLI
jgi:archaellum component FlaC